MREKDVFELHINNFSEYMRYVGFVHRHSFYGKLISGKKAISAQSTERLLFHLPLGEVSLRCGMLSDEERRAMENDLAARGLLSPDGKTKKSAQFA